VTVKISSASRSRTAASDRRAYRPRSWSPASRRISCSGPALITVLYGDRSGVSGNVQRRAAPSSSTRASPELLVTVQPAGAVTVNACGALRSGWSKQAHTWRASSGSNDIQT
jgi:hypothetical protein